MNFLSKFFRSSKPAPAPAAAEALRVPCRADLWCRKRTSLSSMLDPDLYERYMTGDDRIDEEWVVQSNPPCAFKAEFKEGCDALLFLLQIDPGLHATKDWLNFTPPPHSDPAARESYLTAMKLVAQTAERELKPEPAKKS